MVYQMDRAARDPVPARTGPRRAHGAGDSADLRSQVKPAPFAYHQARSVAEAVALLAELGEEAKILAGGLSLVPMMNFRLARPAALVDVSRIVVTGPGGQRAVPAADFFQGYYSTAASPDEMITEIWFPRPAPRAVLTEFAQRQGDFAVVAAAVSADIEDGVCRHGRVVLGGVGPRPVEVNADPLAGAPATGPTWQAMGEHAARQIDPPEDTHGDAGFRRRLTATLVGRALAEASQKAEAQR